MRDGTQCARRPSLGGLRKVDLQRIKRAGSRATYVQLRKASFSK